MVRRIVQGLEIIIIVLDIGRFDERVAETDKTLIDGIHLAGQHVLTA